MASAEKISVYNLADLKNTSDDALPNYLSSLKFRQSHTLTDVRLALGYSAFAIAGACFAWDYKFGFESTKLLTAVAVVVYFMLNTALTYWITFVERGVVYQGVAPGGESITISTATKKNTPAYDVTVVFASGKSKGQKLTTITFSRPFTEWFDAAGHFVALPFQTMFASSVPLIAMADPKRAAVASQSAGEVLSNADASVLAAWAANADGGVKTTGAEAAPAATGKKGKQRRKA